MTCLWTHLYLFQTAVYAIRMYARHHQLSWPAVQGRHYFSCLHNSSMHCNGWHCHSISDAFDFKWWCWKFSHIWQQLWYRQRFVTPGESLSIPLVGVWSAAGLELEKITRTLRLTQVFIFRKKRNSHLQNIGIGISKWSQCTSQFDLHLTWNNSETMNNIQFYAKFVKDY